MQLRDYQVEARDAVLNSQIGQVILPTGTGKSIIQASIIEELIKKSVETGSVFGIYVILTPRVMLTNQLMKTTAEYLKSNGIILSLLTVHSGEEVELYNENSSREDKIVYSNMQKGATTHVKNIEPVLRDARAKNRPVLVCCVYDSAPKLTSALRSMSKSDGVHVNATQVLCDEAHYIVGEENHKIVSDLKEFSERIHFFTATQKVTKGDDGNGMNNVNYYGDVIFRKTPQDMIKIGKMIRPRIHYVEAEEKALWSVIIRDSFIEHQKVILKNPGSAGYNAKMLICSDGTDTIKDVIYDKDFNNWCVSEDITLFSVSSGTGQQINGVTYNRGTFLEKLRAHTGKAIVLHINILTEGIDVPDISGIMYIRNMELCRFLQSLGRATRVLSEDSAKPTDNFLENSKLWKKPYAWVIVAEREGEGQGKMSDIKKMVEMMREAGFRPTEDVVIASDKSGNEPEEFDLSNTPEEKFKSNFNTLFEIFHKVELEELAEMFKSITNDDELFNIECNV